MGSPLAEFLDEIGLSKLLTVLQAESLELEDLAEVEPSEWKAMGVRLGHSKRIRRELRARGALIDSGSMSISGVSNKDTAMPGGPAVVEFRRGPSSAPLRPGAELGPFVLVQELGRGTFGHVWKVDDIQTGTPCALKIVVSATSPRLAQKTLVQEFSVLSRVKDTTHLIRAERPRIERHDGAELLVLPMELADGGTLRDWMLANPRARRGADEDVDRTNRALDLFLSACRGVEALHAADAVHLDLKPANLLLCGGVLKVADFGLSRDLGHLSRGVTQLVEDGVGTPLYMAPEQFTSARPEDVGPAADFWALGVILFELLDGAPPFKARSAAAMEAKLRDPRLKPKMTRIPERFRNAVSQCLDRDEGARTPPLANLSLVRSEAVEPHAPVAFRHPTILVTPPDEPTRQFRFEGEAISIGREPDNDIQVKRDRMMSAHHCRIFRRGDEFIIEDNQSGTGVFVDGHRVVRIRQRLEGGEKIQIGDTMVQLRGIGNG